MTFEGLSWFWFVVLWVILWVGIVIRLESSVIVKLCGFCTVSSESSDVLGSVCVSDGFGCRVSEICDCGGCGDCSWGESGFWKRWTSVSCVIDSFSDCSDCCLIYGGSTLKVCVWRVVWCKLSDVI